MLSRVLRVQGIEIDPRGVAAVHCCQIVMGWRLGTEFAVRGPIRVRSVAWSCEGLAEA